MSVPAPASRQEGSRPWHALPLADVASLLGSDVARGLSAEEAARRLAVHGPNALAEPAPVPWWWTFLAQFRELVIWILLAAAVIAGAMGDWADTAAIVAIVLVNAVIGFLQEDRAQRALAALRTMSTPQARVVRGGTRRSIPSRDLVPGDVIEVEAGDHVPADARVSEAFSLSCQEATLTGESVPVGKHGTDALAADTPLGDRHTLLHAGTVVATGSGAGIVVATGMDSELGRIAGLLEHAPPEPTPLQRRLAALGRILIAVCLVVVAVIFVVELIRGGGFQRLVATGGFAELLLRSVSLAVAAVPEGLPAVVTLVLALGLQRMVRRNALVRRLPSVETLGSVTVICSDKTGTLTRNEMTVRDVLTAARHYAVSGVGYEPRGEFRAADGAPPGDDPDLRRLLEVAARCTTATVAPAADGGGWRVVGDPTEGALLVAAIKAGVAADGTAPPTLFEIPFDSDRKRMSVVVRGSDGGRLLATKGAPEAVLPRCVAEQRDGQVVPLTADRRREILQAAGGLADRALRVLAFAWRSLPPDEPLDGDADGIERDLVLVGLAGMIDPPREEAKAAVARCRSAGIRPVMITGDHPLTARAIAGGIGLVEGGAAAATAENGAEVVLGRELERMDEATLAAVVNRCSVYARVAPEQKLRIVKALQGQRQVVAMTGDGVNDAPALKQAHIGVAMGITGTEVSKEAADMVLLDDNFATIVNAVEEGRLVYANIRRFVKYILGSNVGELLTIAAAPLVGLAGSPMTPLQILWMNLVTDGVPALALALEPGEDGLMQRSPAAPGESIFARGVGRYILRIGVVFALITIVLMVLAARTGAPWKTMVFTTLCLAQMGHALAARSDQPLLRVNPLSNPWLLWAVVLTSALQLMLLYVPSLARFFGTVPLAGRDLAICVGFSLLFFLYLELEKVVRLWRRQASADA